ncbi:MAG: hypothetical protein OQK24_04230 [Magnetovibrio sp.]|nr:hypothetical protein [Magnetovibrio sp.]
MSNQKIGWSWFERNDELNADIHDLAVPDRELKLAYARCFSSEQGKQVISHLRAMTLDRALGPNVSAETLRHIEGQRQLVSYICQLINRGRNGD